jgi:hypothetical protein
LATFKETVDLSQVPRILPAQRPSGGGNPGAEDIQARGGEDPLAPWQVVTFMTMWVGVLYLAGAIEPPPANPNAAPVLGAILITAFLISAVATAMLALTKSRLHTAVASLLTGGVALAITASCPLVGHHHLAPWWFAQLFLVAAPGAWSWRQLTIARAGAR